MDLKEKAWRFQQESLAACHSLWNIHSPMYIFTSVSWEKRSFGQSLELSQFQQFGKQTKNKGLWIYLHTRTTWQLWTRPGVSSAPQLFCSPKLVDQSAKGEKKPKRNKNQTTHEVILTVSLNLILCKSTAQLWTFSQVSIWVWCLYLVSCAWLELWEPTEAQTKNDQFHSPSEGKAWYLWNSRSPEQQVSPWPLGISPTWQDCWDKT